jgi:Putative Tad-like Flp pilus-assembly
MPNALLKGDRAAVTVPSQGRVRQTVITMKHPRKGTAMVVFGLLLPVLLMGAALSVDLAVLAVARSQLSVAADAAALAGAAQLASARRMQSGLTNLNPEIGAANTAAITFAAANQVIRSSAVLSANLNNTTTGDIVTGYLNPNDWSAPFSTAATDLVNFNSVQVTARRDSSHTDVVPAYFARVMGYRGTSVAVTSTATLQPYLIQGYSTGPAQILPIALDQPTWTQMMAGQNTDLYSYNTTTQAVTSGPDGVSESQLYPVANGSPGNWGTLCIGVFDNGTSTIGQQITNGITASQLANVPGGLQLVGTPPSITLGGNPGISAGLKDNLTAIIGKPVAVPIYDQVGGSGGTATYRIIAFQPATILTVNFQWNPKTVTIQPTYIEDPTATPGAATAWTSGGLLRLCLTK